MKQFISTHAKKLAFGAGIAIIAIGATALKRKVAITDGHIAG